MNRMKEGEDKKDFLWLLMNEDVAGRDSLLKYQHKRRNFVKVDKFDNHYTKVL